MKHLLSLILILAFIHTSGQSKITTEDRQKANTYFTSGDWSNALKSYQAIVQQEPKNANALMRLGQSQTALGKNQEAITSLEE